jgi:hypothetical protein
MRLEYWICYRLTTELQCSFERPDCFRCIKSVRACLGYERDRVFIHSDAIAESKKHHKQQSNSSAQHKENLQTISCEIIESSVNQVVGSKSSQSRDIEPRSGKQLIRAGSNHILNGDITWKLQNDSMRQQFVGSFALQYQVSPLSESQGIRSWIADIPFIISPTKALATSTYAIALARLGMLMNDQSLVQESLYHYTHGLSLLQQALWDPKLMYSDETLAACMLLALYEVFECPSETKAGYLSHYNGCAKLVQLRGPELHTYGLGHSVFLGFRFMGVSTNFTSFLYNEIFCFVLLFSSPRRWFVLQRLQCSLTVAMLCKKEISFQEVFRFLSDSVSYHRWVFLLQYSDRC